MVDEDFLHNYKYDAFVSYNVNDSDWVFNKLVPSLEELSFDNTESGIEKSKESIQRNNVRLCVYDRDFIAGRPISECIAESIRTSRKVILVISNNFALSPWCRFETDLAHNTLTDQNREGLILIKLEEIDNEMLEKVAPQLHFLLKTRIYLSWSSDLKEQEIFWKKLRRALGVHKSATYGTVKQYYKTYVGNIGKEKKHNSMLTNTIVKVSFSKSRDSANKMEVKDLKGNDLKKIDDTKTEEVILVEEKVKEEEKEVDVEKKERNEKEAREENKETCFVSMVRPFDTKDNLDKGIEGFSKHCKDKNIEELEEIVINKQTASGVSKITNNDNYVNCNSNFVSHQNNEEDKKNFSLASLIHRSIVSNFSSCSQEENDLITDEYGQTGTAISHESKKLNLEFNSNLPIDLKINQNNDLDGVKSDERNKVKRRDVTSERNIRIDENDEVIQKNKVNKVAGGQKKRRKRSRGKRRKKKWRFR